LPRGPVPREGARLGDVESADPKFSLHVVTDRNPAIAWSLAADPSRRLGRAVEYHAAIGSTNDRARAALADPDGEGLAVVADLQTAGRGRQGRGWLSPPGVNLMCSVGLRPHIPAEQAGLLGLAAAVAVREACRPWAALEIRWPNDLVAAEGSKVAGLLIETALDGERISLAVLGIGINVNWRRAEMPGGIAETATSLWDLAGASVDRVALLTRLLAALDDEVKGLEDGRSPVERYRAASWLDGRQVQIDLGDRQLGGAVAGIADDGSLLVDGPAGRVALSHGEVVRVESMRTPVAAEAVS
jgi:BirA family transcriptional regulator, biotin operon repressor / biotin---[acetyl-CoA-carboxylase] ligase